MFPISVPLRPAVFRLRAVLAMCKNGFSIPNQGQLRKFFLTIWAGFAKLMFRVYFKAVQQSSKSNLPHHGLSLMGCAVSAKEGLG